MTAMGLARVKGMAMTIIGMDVISVIVAINVIVWVVEVVVRDGVVAEIARTDRVCTSHRRRTRSRRRGIGSRVCLERRRGTAVGGEVPHKGGGEGQGVLRSVGPATGAIST